MPTYTYQCENCHYQFEIFQHFSEESLDICPNCSQTTLRKVYSPVGIVFKGSGFYATDHRSPSGQIPSGHDHDGLAAGTEKTAGNKDDGSEKKKDTVKTEDSKKPSSIAPKIAEPAKNSK
jgi:putative FmdB family regulatory protein